MDTQAVTQGQATLAWEQRVKARARVTGALIPALILKDGRAKQEMVEVLQWVLSRQPESLEGEEFNTVLYLDGDIYRVASIDLEFKTIEDGDPAGIPAITEGTDLLLSTGNNENDYTLLSRSEGTEYGVVFQKEDGKYHVFFEEVVEHQLLKEIFTVIERLNNNLKE